MISGQTFSCVEETASPCRGTSIREMNPLVVGSRNYFMYTYTEAVYCIHNLKIRLATVTSAPLMTENRFTTKNNNVTSLGAGNTRVLYRCNQ